MSTPPAQNAAPAGPARRRNRLVVLGVVVGAVVIAGLVVRGTPSPTPNAPGLATSTDPTAWQLPRLGGSGVVALHDFRGKPLVVTFFAAWCTACRDELPAFAQLSETLHGKVAFAGVDSEETADGLSFARAEGIGAWPLASDIAGGADSGLHDALHGTGMPITAFYRADGSLAGVVQGAIAAGDLPGDIARYLGVTAQR